jgi:tyrosyl-tRNA synthetase
MSKSLGNFVGVSEPAGSMFGKLMSISDELMGRYYPMLLGRAMPPDAHPMQAKKDLASGIVEIYHGRAAAAKALDEWNVRFSEKRLSDTELPSFAPQSAETLNIVVAAYLEVFHVQKSRTEASRLIKQGSVQLDGTKITDPKATLDLRKDQVLRLDKTHAVRIA